MPIDGFIKKQPSLKNIDVGWRNETPRAKPKKFERTKYRDTSRSMVKSRRAHATHRSVD